MFDQHRIKIGPCIGLKLRKKNQPAGYNHGRITHWLKQSWKITEHMNRDMMYIQITPSSLQKNSLLNKIFTVHRLLLEN
jgi:hypothetical protein